MEMYPDKSVLLAIVNTTMPFGKYAGRRLCDVPVHYLVWMKQKDAWPKGKTGDLLKNVLEIKTNSLGYIFDEIKSWRQSS